MQSDMFLAQKSLRNKNICLAFLIPYDVYSNIFLMKNTSKFEVKREFLGDPCM